jgi:hypothetical protein
MGLFFSLSNDFLIAALLDPFLLIGAKGLALQSLQIASQVLFRLFEARRILIRKFLHLRLELLELAVLSQALLDVSG